MAVARPTSREVAPRPEVAGPSQNINWGVARHINTRDPFVARRMIRRGDSPHSYTLSTRDTSTAQKPFTSEVTLHGSSGGWLFRSFTLTDQVANAENARREEAKQRAAEKLRPEAVSAMTEVADVAQSDGQSAKIYAVTSDGVDLNQGLRQVGALGHYLGSVDVNWQKLLFGQKLFDTPSPENRVISDPGIAVERVPADLNSLRGYFRAKQQFERSFGADPVAYVTNMFADPYKNSGAIRNLLEHAAIALAASADPNFSGKSEMTTKLETDTDRAHTLKKLGLEGVKILVGAVAGGRGRGKATAEFAGHLLKHVEVAKIDAEDDLLEMAAVGAISHALAILQDPRQDQGFKDWQGEVGNVVRWAFSRIKVDPSTVVPTREIKSEAKPVFAAYGSLKQAVIPQVN